jgi:hypothetical protein
MRGIRGWALVVALGCAAGCARHTVHEAAPRGLLLPAWAFPPGVLLQEQSRDDVDRAAEQVNAGLPGYRAQPAACQADQDRLDAELLTLSQHMVGEVGIDPRSASVYQDMVFAEPRDLREVRAGRLGRCREVRALSTQDGWLGGVEYSVQRAVPMGLRADDALTVVTHATGPQGCGEDKAAGYAVTGGKTVEVEVISDACELDLRSFDALFAAAVRQAQTGRGTSAPVRPFGPIAPRIYGPPMPAIRPPGASAVPRAAVHSRHYAKHRRLR